MSTQLPDNNSLPNTTQEEVNQLRRDLQVVYEELDSVRDELTEMRGQLFRANQLIRQLSVRTTPPFSTSIIPHPLAPDHPLDPHPPPSPSPLPPPSPPSSSSSSSSLLLSPSSSYSTSLSSSSSLQIPTFPNPALNPVPYSTTLHFLLANYELHRTFLHRRVFESDSNLNIVFDYHHLLDVTVNLPPNHHDHL